MKRRWLVQDPVAVTSGGRLLVNLAYIEDVNSVAAVLDVLRCDELRGPVFVGVTLGSVEVEKAMRRLDDAAAELAATAAIRRP
jgi:hypothetical protein